MSRYAPVDSSIDSITPIWRVIVPILVLQLASGFVYSWGEVVPFVQQLDHWPALLTSAVFSAGPLGYATGMVISGRLAEHVPPRRLCWTGAALICAGFFITFLFPSGFTFVFFYAALGLGFGGAIAMAGALAAGITLFPTRVGMIGGMLTGAYALAAIIEAPIVGILAPLSGWLNSLRLVGTCVALLALGTMLLMPSVVRSYDGQAEKATAPFRQLIRRKAIWLGLLLEMTATPLGSYAFVAVAAYAHTFHLQLWMATIAVAAVATGNAFGRIAGGTASDHFGSKRVFLVICVANLAAAFLLFRASENLTVMLAAFLAGISFGGPAGVLSRLASASAPDAPHAAFGLLFAGFALGAFYGPLLGAAVGGGLAWLLLGGIALIGGLILISHLIRERR